MVQPLVSIITPSYNQAGFIEETIRSVLSQDYPRIEYIIIDGGSNDGSVEIIQRYASQASKLSIPLSGLAHSLSEWVSEPDQGQTDAINKGFARAQGDILAWLNSDDTYLPHAVAEAVDYLQTHPELGMVYGDANLIDQDGNIIGKFPARQTNYRRLRQGYVHIPQQAAFFAPIFGGRLARSTRLSTLLWIMTYGCAWLAWRPYSIYRRLWANFRLHGTGKSVIANDRCWPEMLRVHYREGGSWLSPLVFKARVRPLIYSWIPLNLRVWLRQKLP